MKLRNKSPDHQQATVVTSAGEAQFKDGIAEVPDDLGAFMLLHFPRAYEAVEAAPEPPRNAPQTQPEAPGATQGAQEAPDSAESAPAPQEGAKRSRRK